MGLNAGPRIYLASSELMGTRGLLLPSVFMMPRCSTTLCAPQQHYLISFLAAPSL